MPNLDDGRCFPSRWFLGTDALYRKKLLPCPVLYLPGGPPRKNREDLGRSFLLEGSGSLRLLLEIATALLSAVSFSTLLVSEDWKSTPKRVSLAEGKLTKRDQLPPGFSHV